jgi:flagellar motor switch protein FliN/FliY
VADAGVPDEAEPLWWEQKIQSSSPGEMWIAAPKRTWEYVGTVALKAAGLETSAPEEVKNTWLEILGQWTSGFTRSLGLHVGSQVVCEGGAEHPPAEHPREWASVLLRFGDDELPPLAVAWSAPLLSLLTLHSGDEHPDGLETVHAPAPPQNIPGSARTMELLLDVELPVSISFGRTQLPLKDVLKLTTGSIIELNRGVSEPVELLVNHCLVARGEVVVVDGNYGIRIQQIASREDRLRTLR